MRGCAVSRSPNLLFAPPYPINESDECPASSLNGTRDTVTLFVIHEMETMGNKRFRFDFEQ